MSWFKFTRTRRSDETESEWHNNIGNNVKFFDEITNSEYEPEESYVWMLPYYETEENLINQLENPIVVTSKRNGKKRYYQPRKQIPRKLKDHLIALRGFACENCQENGFAHIHHIDENPGNNNPDNLRLLCKECHKKIHAKH